MITGEFNFNMKDNMSRRKDLPQYSYAYAATNEPIEKWQPMTSIKGARVLTVAASGDQALMYAAAGATQVDTFDITISACAIMDFKTTALKRLSYSEYKDSVWELATMYNNLSSLYRIIKYSRYPKIFTVAMHMPRRTRNIMLCAILKQPYKFVLNTNKEGFIFPHDIHQYDSMRDCISKPFNFIWCDLMNLHKYIDGKYDIINLSNIFDHYIKFQQKEPKSILDTVRTLLPHLNRGGYILCTTGFDSCRKLHLETLGKLQGYKISVTCPETQCNTNWRPIIIQKTR